MAYCNFVREKKIPTNGKDPSLPRTFMIGSLPGSSVVGGKPEKVNPATKIC